MITSDFALVCMSRHRATTLPKQSLRFFPSATICVAEAERDAYAKLSGQVLTHPDDVTGIGPVRQWILDHVDSRVVFIVPDDIVMCYGLVSTYARRFTDADAIVGLLRNTAECSEDAGAKLCGFNQAWDVRKFSPFQPFSLASWVDGPMGFLTREIRFDPQLKLHPDIDFFLQHLRQYRLVWQDSRYAFAHDRWTQAGGNAVHRTQEAHDTEYAYLKRKWGAHLEVRWAKTTFISKVHVERRQAGI